MFRDELDALNAIYALLAKPDRPTRKPSSAAIGYSRQLRLRGVPIKPIIKSRGSVKNASTKK